MVEMKMIYEGQLHCKATHGPSGSVIVTDAPKDNMGKGEAFSPTDLVGAALGTCMLTIMGIYAQKNSLDITGTSVTVTKEMMQQPVRRIKKLTVDIHFSKALSDKDKTAIQNAAHACPVHKSLHPDIEVPVVFHWSK